MKTYTKKTRFVFFISFFLCFAFLVSSPVLATIETSYTNGDVVLSYNEPDLNKQCTTYGDIGSWSSYGGHAYRYITKTDISGVVADPSQIIKAIFNIDRVSTTWDSDNNYVLQVVSESWDPSTVNWGNQPSVNPSTIPPLGQTYGIFKFDITEIVKNWLIDPSSNFGLLIKKTSEDTTLTDNKGLFACSDYPEAGSENRPYITVESCVEDEWTCSPWEVCSPEGEQSRICTKSLECPNVDLPVMPELSQSCIPPVPTCDADIWECGNWGACSENGQQTRSCNKTYDCPVVVTPSPNTNQSCTPIVSPKEVCDDDTWVCEDWGVCSLSGFQTRGCQRTFDCPGIITALPETERYCDSPNKPLPVEPNNPNGTVNQDSIIKSTVKLVCPFDDDSANQGSGTLIDQNGTILTNKHVVDGTAGCFVGFIDEYNDDPYFSQLQIADILSVSDNYDIALLKLRNPQGKNLTSVDVSKNVQSSLTLGDRIITYGYPAQFGITLTYTSGDFSGVNQGYLKTSAIIEYGNSGGGAYLVDGTFVGIPTAVVRGELNSLGYILPIDSINAWINNESPVYTPENNNEYSRVKKVLDSFNVVKISSLKLSISKKDNTAIEDIEIEETRSMDVEKEITEGKNDDESGEQNYLKPEIDNIQSGSFSITSLGQAKEQQVFQEETKTGDFVTSGIKNNMNDDVSVENNNQGPWFSKLINWIKNLFSNLFNRD